MSTRGKSSWFDPAESKTNSITKKFQRNENLCCAVECGRWWLCELETGESCQLKGYRREDSDLLYWLPMREESSFRNAQHHWCTAAIKQNKTKPLLWLSHSYNSASSSLQCKEQILQKMTVSKHVDGQPSALLTREENQAKLKSTFDRLALEILSTESYSPECIQFYVVKVPVEYIVVVL